MATNVALGNLIIGGNMECIDLFNSHHDNYQKIEQNDLMQHFIDINERID